MGGWYSRREIIHKGIEDDQRGMDKGEGAIEIDGPILGSKYSD